MYSLKELFKVGNGPSSSHTMGPKNAALDFLNRYPKCNSFTVTLYESLALTGCGHLTDYIIIKTLGKDRTKVIFDMETRTVHPNTLNIKGYLDDELVASEYYYSVGGGIIKTSLVTDEKRKPIYNETSFDEVYDFCTKKNISLVDYINLNEEEDIDSFLLNILDVMDKAIIDGLNNDGVLPGRLGLKRKAKYFYENPNPLLEKNNLIAYAYAVCEENASGNIVVTSPTCGASGVLPAVIRYLREKLDLTREKELEGLKIAGLIGNIIKTEGSISGAEAGCQAEVGSACSMAAAYTAYMYGANIKKIERASEIALEHHLGLTCDPVEGYVQIPCIERNAVAALRAIDAAMLALALDSNEAKISFDMCVETMLETGKSLPREFRETSKGGLAKKYGSR